MERWAGSRCSWRAPDYRFVQGPRHELGPHAHAEHRDPTGEGFTQQVALAGQEGEVRDLVDVHRPTQREHARHLVEPRPIGTRVPGVQHRHRDPLILERRASHAEGVTLLVADAEQRLQRELPPPPPAPTPTAGVGFRFLATSEIA